MRTPAGPWYRGLARGPTQDLPGAYSPGVNRYWLLPLLLLSVACGEEEEPPDAGGGRDAMPADVSGTDAGDMTDAGIEDADAGAGLPDRNTTPLQPDRDGDGIPDSEDAFPDDPAEFYDDDQNGVGNWAQADEDGDGTPDVDDAYPFDPGRSGFPEVTEVEPNDPDGDPPTVVSELPVVLVGTLANEDDVDAFEIPVTEGLPLAVAIEFDVPPMKARSRFFEMDQRSFGFEVHDAPGRHVQSYDVRMDGTARLDIKSALGGQFFDEIRSTSTDYRVTVYVDADLDGLDDGFERALGMRPDHADPDGDLVGDADEALLSALDADGDGLPNWLDDDADGNGRSDGSDGVLDRDEDGVPAFLDDDDDGDGVTDVDALAGGPGEGADLDGDRQPDFADLDDDGDGLPDGVDPQPTTPLPLVEPGDADPLRIMLVRSDHGTFETDNFARIGDTLLLDGLGFASAAADNTIVFRGRYGPVIATATDIVQTSTVEATLTVIVPAGAEADVAVISGGRRSGFRRLRITPADTPVIAPPPPDTVFPALDTPTGALTGIGFDEGVAVLMGGNRTGVSNWTSTSLQFTAPRFALEGRTAMLSRSGYLSNFVTLAFAQPTDGTVEIPSGSGVLATDLTVDSHRDRTDAVPAVDGTFQIMRDAHGADVMSAYHPPDVNGDVTVFLQAYALPSDTAVALSAESTAVALLMQALVLGSRYDVDTLRLIRDAVAGLTETALFAVQLESDLASDPNFLGTSMNPTTKSAFQDAFAAAEGVMAMYPPVPPPTASPLFIVSPPEIDDVTVSHVEGNPLKIEIENDTQLFLSASLVTTEGELLKSHASAYFDRDIIKPQARLEGFYDATNEKLDPILGRNTILTVITPGGAGTNLTAAEANIRRILSLRTIISRVVLPVLTYLLSAEFDGNEVAEAIIDAVLKKGPARLAVIDNYIASGNDDQLASDILGLVLSDLKSAAQSAIKKAIGKRLTAFVAAKVAARSAAKGIPVANVIAWAAEIVDVSILATDLAKVSDDYSRTGSKLSFSVSYDLEITRVTPHTLAPEEEEKDVFISGYSFNPKGVRNNYTNPRIIFTDLGENGFGTYETRPRLHFVTDEELMATSIPAVEMAQAVGPIQVEVVVQLDNGSMESAIADRQIQVSRGFMLDAVEPNEGAPGDTIQLIGSEFRKPPFLLRAVFYPAGDPNAGAEIGRVVARSENIIEVVLPEGIRRERDWTVHIFQDGRLELEESNRLPFTYKSSELEITDIFPSRVQSGQRPIVIKGTGFPEDLRDLRIVIGDGTSYRDIFSTVIGAYRDPAQDFDVTMIFIRNSIIAKQGTWKLKLEAGDEDEPVESNEVDFEVFTDCIDFAGGKLCRIRNNGAAPEYECTAMNMTCSEIPIPTNPAAPCLAFHPGVMVTESFNGSQNTAYCFGQNNNSPCQGNVNVCHHCPACNPNYTCQTRSRPDVHEFFALCQ